MDEYRMEFDENYLGENENSGELQHYRLQIDKLEQKIKEDGNTYKKRIA